MQLEEILNAIEMLDASDLVPVLETVTAKLAESFWYIDSYVWPIEWEGSTEDIPAEEVPAEELPTEELPEDARVSL